MKTSDVDHMLRDRVAGKRGVGIVAGMIESGGDAELTMVGERGTGELIDASTVFESGSLAKVLTGTLLADMVLRGEASLEIPSLLTSPTTSGSMSSGAPLVQSAMTEQSLHSAIFRPMRSGKTELLDLATHTSAGLGSA